MPPLPVLVLGAGSKKWMVWWWAGDAPPLQKPRDRAHTAAHTQRQGQQK